MCKASICWRVEHEPNHLTLFPHVFHAIAIPSECYSVGLLLSEFAAWGGLVQSSYNFEKLWPAHNGESTRVHGKSCWDAHGIVKILYCSRRTTSSLILASCLSVFSGRRKMKYAHWLTKGRAYPHNQANWSYYESVVYEVGSVWKFNRTWPQSNLYGTRELRIIYLFSSHLRQSLNFPVHNSLLLCESEANLQISLWPSGS